MNLVSINRRALKSLKSKDKSIKEKYNAIYNELKEVPFDGKVYKSLNGEHLFKLDGKKAKVYSVELAKRLRLVYEYYDLGDKYSITITDVANHEYEGHPYLTIFSE